MTKKAKTGPITAPNEAKTVAQRALCTSPWSNVSMGMTNPTKMQANQIDKKPIAQAAQRLEFRIKLKRSTSDPFCLSAFREAYHGKWVGATVRLEPIISN